MRHTKTTPFTVSILQPTIPGQPSVYRLQYDGKTLYPDLYRDWISAAYLLKGCEPPADTIGNFNVWRLWASQSSVKHAQAGIDQAGIDQVERIWSAINSQTGVEQAIDDAKRAGDPDLLVEQTGDPDLLIVRIEHNPRRVRLYLKQGELDCADYGDWMAGAAALRSPEIRPPVIENDDLAFCLWNEWSCQSEKHAQAAREDRIRVWETLPITTQAPVPAEVAADAPEPVQSARSQIGQVLNRYTENAGSVLGYSFDLYSAESVSGDTISDSSLVVRNLPELQQQLADLVETLITERIGQQQVLKARGATVLDCHQLGLLSDDDMANHMADCLMVILGKPVGAKAAKAVILAAAGHVRDEPPIDFNQDVILQPPPREVTNIGWEKPVRVSFDGAEGQGRVWLHVDHEHDEDEPAIAVPGVDNARHLAKLLNAWADDYNPKSEQPQ
jgi:hypothetical protein